MTVGLSDWAGVATVLATGLAALGLLLRKMELLRTELTRELVEFRAELKGDDQVLRTELKDDIGNLRTELKDDIGQFRAEVRADLSRLDGRLTTIEQRTYDLSTRLPPATPVGSPGE